MRLLQHTFYIAPVQVIMAGRYYTSVPATRFRVHDIRFKLS
jgi:hypothetical protein